MAAKRSGGDCIWKEQWKVPNLWFNFAGEQRANRRHWCLPMLCHSWQWTSSSVIWRIEAGRYFYFYSLCLIFQFEELLKKSRQILSRYQNINKNSGADWSVRHLRGKTIIKKENWDWDWKIRYIFLFFRHFAYIVLLLYWSDSAAWASGQPQVFSLRKSHT